MSANLLSFVLMLLVVVGCLFAFWKGGPAERLGAGVIFANLLLTSPVDMVWANATYGVYGLLIDGLTAGALLFLALRYASLWLGGVMLLYGVQFGLHAFYFVTERRYDLPHMIINNSDFMGVVVCLVAGTAIAWRRRDASAPSAA
jgi:hypothetical protein